MFIFGFQHCNRRVMIFKKYFKCWKQQVRTIPLILIILTWSATADELYFCETKEPCEAAEVSILYQQHSRYENCLFRKDADLCDRYIDPGWYRFEDEMLNHCPQLLSCGALYPIWLNGAVPTKGGLVRSEACKVGFSSCCVKKYPIMIKDCGSYKAYCLSSLDGCSERYCFGENGTCGEHRSLTAQGTTETTYSHKIMTGTSPKLATSASSSALERRSTTKANDVTTRSSVSTDNTASIQCKEDPCQLGYINYIPEPEERDFYCEYKFGSQHCDSSIRTQWYKSTYLILNKMPHILGCGAIYPVWMNGSIPSKTDGVVSRNACKIGSRSSCEKTYHIKVRNCGKFVAYCLVPLDRDCEERYCFGDSVQCTDKKGDVKGGVKLEDIKQTKTEWIVPVLCTFILCIIIGLATVYMIRWRCKHSKKVSSEASHYETTKKKVDEENPYAVCYDHTSDIQYDTIQLRI